jgi:hypothetical protein
VRLNGRRVGTQLGEPRRGVRALRASVSHGLKRGRNVLTVRRGKRTTRVRFVVRPRAALLGAGLDRQVAIAGPVALKAIVRGGGDRPVRWRIVDRSRQLGTKRTRQAAVLRSPKGRSARFRAAVPGDYTLELEGRGARDRVVLSAVQRTKLVAIDTMTKTGDTSGIEVDGHFYPVSAAPDSGYQVQVLVLDRETLEPASNDTYGVDAGQKLKTKIDSIDDGELVVVSDQGPVAPRDLDAAVAEIGVPALGVGATESRTFSAIGVPGMKPGDADFRRDPGNQGNGQAGELKGWLTPDQNGNYGFVHPERITFSAGRNQVDPCGAGDDPNTCRDNIGFRLNVYDAYTREVRPGDNRVYNTGGWRSGTGTDEVNRLAQDLNAVAPGDTIALTTVGLPQNGQYAPVIGTGVHYDAIGNLGQAIARMGGTRQGLVSTLRYAPPPESKGVAYALFGWAGAPEGAAAEVAANVDGAGPAPAISGVWRPGLDSQFRPSVAKLGVDPMDALGALTVQAPTPSWPLDDDPGAKQALSYLGSQDARLGPDPRSAYWIQGFEDISEWRDIADVVEDVDYPDGQGFSAADFDKAQRQLIKELRWVYRVRSYLDQVTTPFQDNSGVAWADTHTIADKVYKALHPPADSQVAISVLQVLSSLLKMIGPFTDGATTVAAGAIDLGINLFGATQGGAPTANDLDVAADDLANELESQAKDSQETIDRMGDVLVSDYAKLSVVGPNALCNPTAPGCDRQWSFTADDRRQASTMFQRGIERTAWERLLPLGYTVLQLRIPNGMRPRPLDIASYHCRTYNPFSNVDYKDAVSVAVPVNLDSPTGLWDFQTYVIAETPSGEHGGYPPQDMLDRMFGPVSKSREVAKGGLGISMPAYALSAKRTFWEGSLDNENYYCSWPDS